MRFGSTSRLPHTHDPETYFPTTTSTASGSRTQQGGTLEGCRPIRLGLSGSSLQADPRRIGGTLDLVLPDGAHHLRSEEGPRYLRTRKHSPGVGEEGGPEGH